MHSSSGPFELCSVNKFKYKVSYNLAKVHYYKINLHMSMLRGISELAIAITSYLLDIQFNQFNGDVIYEALRCTKPHLNIICCGVGQLLIEKGRLVKCTAGGMWFTANSIPKWVI